MAGDLVCLADDDKIIKTFSLPPNFSFLPDDLKLIVSEDVYRKQLMWRHGKAII